MTDPNAPPPSGLTEAVIRGLITIGIVVGLIYVVLWFVQSILGIPLPTNAIRIMWGIVALVCILIFIRMFRPWIGNWLP